MNRKLFLLCFSLFMLINLAYSQKVGERVLKRFFILGREEYRWAKYLSVEEYNQEGQMISFENEAYKTSIYEYDDKGNLIHIKNDYAEKWYEYDDLNREILYRDTEQAVTVTYDYSENYKRTTIDEGDEYKTIIEDFFDNFGNLVHRKSVDLVRSGSYINEFWIEYDKQGREIKITNSIGEETASEYDLDGKLIKREDKKIKDGKVLLLITNYEYDANGYLIAEKRSDGYELFYENDDKGRKTSRRDTNGTITNYDEKGNIIYYKSKDTESCKQFDSKGNEVYYRINTSEYVYEYEYYSKGKKKTCKEYLLDRKK